MHTRNVTAPGKLQMDVKVVTPELSGILYTCYLYGVVDIYSRYKQGVSMPYLKQESAALALHYLLEKFPFEADFVQTDNGLEFQSEFHRYVLEEIEIEHHYIHKSSPNENAVIERSLELMRKSFSGDLTHH